MANDSGKEEAVEKKKVDSPEQPPKEPRRGGFSGMLSGNANCSGMRGPCTCGAWH